MRFEFNTILIDNKWNIVQDLRTALVMEAGKVYLERNDREIGTVQAGEHTGKHVTAQVAM